MNTEALIQQLIDRDIYANASTMVADLTNEGSHWADDLFPACIGDDLSEAPAGYRIEHYATGNGQERAWRWVCTETEDGFATHDDAVRGAYDDACEDIPQREALQYWLVSDYLADELEAVGALVARDVLGFNVWGRTECGQSLTLDSDLNRVAERIAARNL